MRWTWRRAVALVLAASSVAAACGGDDDQGEASGAQERASATVDGSEPAPSRADSVGQDGDEGLEPVDGGVLIHGVFSETAGLDPVVTFGGGATGTTELGAIYDTLMRYDTETGEFVPHLAKSLTPNNDHSVWTLTLRPDVTFTDGTALDAEAVVFGLKRHVKHQSRAALLVSMIEEYNVVDDTTLELVLSRSYPNFPYVLSFTPGMIPSPTAVKKQCEVGQADEIPARECPFNSAPVGAGPYMVSTWNPGDMLVLKPNPDYWGGTPHLDELRFVVTVSGSMALESLQTGSLQSAYTRDARPGREAEQDPEINTYLNRQWMGDAIALNNGVVPCVDGQPSSVCPEGKDGSVELDVPTADVRIRQAVAAAIDGDVLNQRVDDGAGFYSGSMFQKDSQWESSEPLHTFDPDRARALVEEVKAEGQWDGSVRLRCSKSQTELAVAIEAMLIAVGFDVEVTADADVATNINAIRVQKDFDAACFGFSTAEEAPEVAFMLSLNAQAPNNVMNHDITEIDEHASALIAGATHEERLQALEAIQDVWRTEMPAVVLGAVPERIMWRDEVHGIVPNVWTTVLWHDVWIDHG